MGRNQSPEKWSIMDKLKEPLRSLAKIQTHLSLTPESKLFNKHKCLIFMHEKINNIVDKTEEVAS
jgi:hypothetical protein